MAFVYFNNTTPNPDTTANKALSGWNVMSNALGAMVENLIQYAPLIMNMGPESSVALDVEGSANTSFKVTAGRINTPFGPIQLVEYSGTLGDANEHMAVLVLALKWSYNKNVDFQSVEGVNIPIDEFDELGIDGAEVVTVGTNGSQGTNDAGYYNPADGKLTLESLTFGSNLVMNNISKGAKSFWTYGTYLNQSAYETNSLFFAFPLGFLKADSASDPAQILETSEHATDIGRFTAGGGGGVSSWEDIPDKPSSYPSTWGQVSGKPSVYPTNWENVSDPPAKYAPTNHIHTREIAFTFPASQTSQTVVIPNFDMNNDEVEVYIDRGLAGDNLDVELATYHIADFSITAVVTGVAFVVGGVTPTSAIHFKLLVHQKTLVSSDPTPATNAVQQSEESSDEGL